MKTVKLLGMAAIAVLMGVGFASCSKENPSGNGNETPEKTEDFFYNEKKLVKETWESGSGSTGYYIYEYDDKGRLTRFMSDSGWGSKGIEYIWGDDAIQEIGNGNDIYTVKDGLIQDGDITYNKSNRPVEIQNWDDNKTTLIWDSDKLMSIVDGVYLTTLTYGEPCKKGYFPYNPLYLEMPLAWAHPELFGIRTKQLPATITEKYDGFNYEGTLTGGYVATSTYTYEFDKDGYIVKTIEQYNKVSQDGTKTSYTYTTLYTWE